MKTFLLFALIVHAFGLVAVMAKIWKRGIQKISDVVAFVVALTFVTWALILLICT